MQKLIYTIYVSVLALIDFAIKCWVISKFVSVDWLALNPCWLTESFGTIKGSSKILINFSNIIESKHNTLTGLLISIKCDPFFLYINKILEIFFKFLGQNTNLKKN